MRAAVVVESMQNCLLITVEHVLLQLGEVAEGAVASVKRSSGSNQGGTQALPISMIVPAAKGPVRIKNITALRYCFLCACLWKDICSWILDVGHSENMVVVGGVPEN